MVTVSRNIVVERLQILGGQGYCYAMRVLGCRVADGLTAEQTTPLEFLRVYLEAMHHLMTEEPRTCIQDFGTLASANENMAALMMNVAEFVGSREFSEEVFASLQRFLDYRLLMTTPAGTTQ